MRQRGVKNRDLIYENCRNYAAENPTQFKGSWEADCFGRTEKKPLLLEIGSGKGQFIIQAANAHQTADFLACEGGENINIRILQKANADETDNLRVITEYITEPLKYFEENELEGLYINFCDPWPKDRHAKRRLTYRGLLEQYRHICKGLLYFKTDNDALFEWSLEEFKAVNFETVQFTRDLWRSDYFDREKQELTYSSSIFPTEYETKFAGSGKTINYIALKMK